MTGLRPWVCGNAPAVILPMNVTISGGTMPARTPEEQQAAQDRLRVQIHRIHREMSAMNEEMSS